MSYRAPGGECGEAHRRKDKTWAETLRMLQWRLDTSISSSNGGSSSGRMEIGDCGNSPPSWVARGDLCLVDLAYWSWLLAVRILPWSTLASRPLCRGGCAWGPCWSVQPSSRCRCIVFREVNRTSYTVISKSDPCHHTPSRTGGILHMVARGFAYCVGFRL